MRIFKLVLLATTVSADWMKFQYDHAYYATNACEYAITNSVLFCKTNNAVCTCGNENYIASWLKCNYEKTSEFDKRADMWVAENCKGIKGALSTEEMHSVYQNATKFVDINEQYVNKSVIFKHPIVSSGEHFAHLYTDSYWTYNRRYGNQRTSEYLGIAFIAFVGLVMIVSGIVNWGQRASKSFHVMGNNRFVNFFRKHFTLGILRTHLSPSRLGYTPDRMESFWIFVMCLYTILSNCIIGYYWNNTDVSFDNIRAGTGRYWGDRSAIILSYQIPLLFMFPGRNNIFQILTRWKYSRFITFHKWLARCVFFEILVHGTAYAVQTYNLTAATIYSRLHVYWYLYGIVSAVFAAVLIITSVHFIRNRWYDIFKVIHIVFAACVLWTALIHARTQEAEGYFYAAVAVWCFEYVARISRILLNGVKKASVEYFEDDNVIKVIIPENKFLKMTAGSHSFLYFVTPLHFYKSHCFTAVPCATPGYIEYVCKVKNGLTLNLAKSIKAKGTVEMTVLVEGYYGEASPYQHFDKVVFVTGSTGIAGPYAHAVKIAENHTDKEVNLYWSVRTLCALEWFKDELLALRKTHVKPIVYVSQPYADVPSSGTESNSDNASEKNEAGETRVDEKGVPLELVITSEKQISKKIGSEILDFVEIRHGRLDVVKLVEEEIKTSTGTVAFGGCSNPQIVDTLRKEVAKNLSATGKKVEYFEEMQTW